MSVDRFEQSVRIDARREAVHAELSEPARQVGLQPLVVEVRERPAPGPGRLAFEAVERIRLVGPIAFRNRIDVEVDTGDPACVCFRARSPGAVRVRVEFHLAAVGEGTEVRECVEVEIPRWLAPIRAAILRQAAAAHARLLEGLKSRLEPGS